MSKPVSGRAVYEVLKPVPDLGILPGDVILIQDRSCGEVTVNRELPRECRFRVRDLVEGGDGVRLLSITDELPSLLRQPHLTVVR